MARYAEKDLFVELYPSLRRFAAVVGDDDMEPDDLVQEALTSALTRGSLSDLDKPGAFLRKSIMNLIRSSRRSAGRRAAKANLIAGLSAAAVRKRLSRVRSQFTQEETPNE